MSKRHSNPQSRQARAHGQAPATVRVGAGDASMAAHSGASGGDDLAMYDWNPARGSADA